MMVTSCLTPFGVGSLGESNQGFVLDRRCYNRTRNLDVNREPRSVQGLKNLDRGSII